MAPFVEASEQLKSQTERLLDPRDEDDNTYRASIETLLENLEDAFRALYGKARDA